MQISIRHANARFSISRLLLELYEMMTKPDALFADVDACHVQYEEFVFEDVEIEAFMSPSSYVCLTTEDAILSISCATCGVEVKKYNVNMTI